MTALDPVRLMTLAAVETRGGVVAAADALHLTPSAVSQQLRQLEREAGVALLDRSGRQTRLTEAGRRLAARGRRIRRELVRAVDDLEPWTELEDRLLAVASFETAIRQLIAPLAASGALADSGLRLRVVEIEGQPAIRELHAGTVDVVLREELLRAEGRRSEDPFDTAADPRTRLVIDDPFQVVVPAAWALPTGTEQVRRALTERPWVAQAPGTAGGEMLADLETRWGFAARVAHQCVEYTSAVALVSAGAGATLAPNLALPREGAAPTVRVLQVGPGLAMRRIRGLCRPSRRPPVAIDRLLAIFGEGASGLGLRARLAPDHASP